MPDEARTQPLNVFLLRDGVDGKEALDDTSGMKCVPVELGAVTGELWIKPPSRGWPGWVKFLGVGESLPKSWQPQTLSAVLLVPLAGSRTAAVAFGQGGRFLLDSEKYERGFGLRAALNSVDPDKVRGLSGLTLGGFGMQTERHTAREAPVGAFEHDELRDLVGSLAGTPMDIEAVTSISGRDGAAVVAKVARAGVPVVAARLVALDASTTYKSNYAFADNIVPADGEDAEQRTMSLVASLREGNLEGIGLHPPEVFDSSRTVGFALSTGLPDPATFEEASIARLAKELAGKKDAQAALVRLRRLRLWAIPDDAGDIPRWPALRCLSVERRTPAGASVLHNGRWWCAAGSLVKVIDDDLARLPRSELPLPKWDKAVHAKEGDYNAFAADEQGWFNLDQKTVKLSGRSAIEVCDLLTPKRELVHVKSYSGSGVLSHLFAQGSVSAELLSEAPAFRTALRKKVTDANFRKLVPGARAAYDPTDFTIIYAIGAEGTGAVEDTLPFFSRLHLRTHLQRIRRLGYALPHVQRFQVIPKHQT
jgi:uncharacterized protein (TIGR04141 family)